MRPSPGPKPQIERFEAKSESLTEMAVHFLRILPSLKVCPFDDADIVQLLINAVNKASDKVICQR